MSLTRITYPPSHHHYHHHYRRRRRCRRRRRRRRRRHRRHPHPVPPVLSSSSLHCLFLRRSVLFACRTSCDLGSCRASSCWVSRGRMFWVQWSKLAINMLTVLLLSSDKITSCSWRHGDFHQ